MFVYVFLSFALMDVLPLRVVPIPIIHRSQILGHLKFKLVKENVNFIRPYVFAKLFILLIIALIISKHQFDLLVVSSCFFIFFIWPIPLGTPDVLTLKKIYLLFTIN